MKLKRLLRFPKKIYNVRRSRQMLQIRWCPPEIPEYDPAIHSPEKVFALLCYRGISYAKWVYLDKFL